MNTLSSVGLLKELVALGFSPVNAVLIIGLITVWVRFEWANRNQSTTREEWHEETRKRVEEVEEHAEECYRDRDGLREELSKVRAQLAVFNERAERAARCPKNGCPNRLP